MAMTPDQLFTTLAHRLRLRAAMLLHAQGELCVCELTHVFATPQPVVSRHLAQLRKSGVVTSRREGTWIHYRLADDLPGWAQSVITASSTADPDHATDRQALLTMSNRPGHAC